MFVYDTTNTETLKTYLSEERLKPYFIKSRGDSWIAFALYIRNTEISSSLYVPLQAFEVALRNIVHARMSEALNSEGWWAKLPLGAKELKDVDKAKSYLLSRQPDKTRSLENITTGQIVAELGFGFWTKLFSNSYEKELWVPYIHSLFPEGLSRKNLYERLSSLKELRNRIAHYETLIKRNVMQDYTDLLEAIQWISPVMYEWVQGQCTFEQTYAKKLPKRPKHSAKSDS